MTAAPPRPSLSKARKLRLWERDKGICYLCGEKVALGEPWDAEHKLAWALSFDDSDENLAVAHKLGCHEAKTKTDVKSIAKAKRQGGVESGQKARRDKAGKSRLQGRPFQKGVKRAWGSRPFPKKIK